MAVFLKNVLLAVLSSKSAAFWRGFGESFFTEFLFPECKASSMIFDTLMELDWMLSFKELLLNSIVDRFFDFVFSTVYQEYEEIAFSKRIKLPMNLESFADFLSSQYISTI